MNLSMTGIGTALTQVTEAKQHVSISIPAGKGGVLRAVELQVWGTLETIVNGGGKVVLTNTSADWAPFELISPTQTSVTLGGLAGHPARFPCTKELPGNSTAYADYTPYDNQSQKLSVTLIWEKGAAMGSTETFAKVNYPLKAAAVTATTRASSGTIAIPGGKGGTSVYLGHFVYPTVETVVNGGGKAEWVCDAYDIVPTDFYTTVWTTVGAGMGGGVSNGHIVPYVMDVPANSTFTIYYTPQDDQSQTLASLLIWEHQKS